LPKTSAPFKRKYTVEMQTVFDGLGFPVYEKNKIIPNQSMGLYAYRFDYQGDKDF
jgi:hypothetical protein